MDLPDWSSLLSEMLDHPKPPVYLEVVRYNRDGAQTTATALHDGKDLWSIHINGEHQLSTRTSALFHSEGRFTHIPDGKVAASTWLKALVHGYLWWSTGSYTATVERSAVVLNRVCWVVRLDDRSDDGFTIYVDDETAVVLRIETNNNIPIVEVTTIRTANEPESH